MTRLPGSPGRSREPAHAGEGSAPAEFPDRRGADRSTSVPNRARLRWQEAGGCRESPARFLNISRAGALIAADDPPRDAMAWVRLEEPTLTGWFEVRVARLAAGCLIGLTFPHSCPQELRAALIIDRPS